MEALSVALRATQDRLCLPEAEARAVLGPLVEALPPCWRTANTTEDGAAFRHKDGRIAVLSVARCTDDRRWLHASISRSDRLPDYSDLVELHRHFIGADRRALQVFAPTDKHVNIHPWCLHLWACIDGDGLPDFTAGTGSI